MRILLCSDGSEQAENAVRLVLSVIKDREARITLLGIAETLADKAPLLEALKREQRILENRNCTCELVTLTGEPIVEIKRRTQETQYDLTVLGAVRRKLRGRFVMSGRAYRIIKSISTPALVSVGDITEVKEVLICTSGRSWSSAAVESAARIIGAEGVKATLFHVIPEVPTLYAGFVRPEQDVDSFLASKSRAALSLGRERKILKDFEIETRVKIGHGIVTDRILREIKNRDYSLIVVGTWPTKAPLRTYVLGDVTREVINRAECPILVVRTEPANGALQSTLGRLKNSILGRILAS